jgi:recombination DNA repair RAD52 pathway protein
LRTSIGSGIDTVMVSLGYDERKGYGSAERLGESWAAGDKSAKNEVAGILQKAQLTIEDVMAETLKSKIDSFERIDRMLASAEARRNNALREIDRRREAMGIAIRRSIDEAEDVEFRDVETGKTRGAGES